MMFQGSSFVIASLLLCVVNAKFVPYGFQSGHDMGSSYAGGMVYDHAHHLIFMTGQTYGEYFMGDDAGVEPDPVASNCFFGIAELPFEGSGTNKVQWLHTQEVGNSTVPEACVSLVSSRTHNKLYAIGHSEEYGKVARIRPFGTTRSLVYGMVADLDVKMNAALHGIRPTVSKASLELKGGRLLHPTKGVHYPMAAAIEGVDGAVFMASMSSTNSEPSLEVLPPNKHKPDLTKGGYKKYGRDYSVIIEKIVPLAEPVDATDPDVDLKETLKVEWSWEGGAKNNNDDEDVEVHLTTLIHADRETLIFAGSTMGFGQAFGNNIRSTADDFDGFVTKMDPKTGAIPTSSGKRFSARLGSDDDDYINAVCHHEDSIYVVGTTYGILGPNDEGAKNVGGDAFLVKMDLDTLDIMWILQFGAELGPNSEPDGEANAHAITCHVTKDGNNVYVAGNVDDGAIMIAANGGKGSSLGGDDVFLAQVNANNGDVNYVIQEGTAQHDRVAHGGGLVVDDDGNAIVMGTTKGAFLREKNHQEDKTTDIFFLSFNVHTGEHLVSLERIKASHTGIIPNPNPVPNLPPGGTPQAPAPTPNPAPTPKPKDDDDDGGPAYVDDDADDDTADGSKDDPSGVSGGVIFLCVMVGLTFLGVGIYVVRRTKLQMLQKHPDSPNHIDPVSPYLVNFNYGDVDLKHSATGGFQGVYTNPNYKDGMGHRHATSIDPEMELEEIKFNVGATTGGAISSSQFDASIVRNSLFMDDLDVPQLGDADKSNSRRLASQEEEEDLMGDNPSGSSRQLSTYDDLLDAYNTTWDDLNPHKLPGSGLSATGTSGQKKESESAGLLDSSNDKDDPWGKEII